MTSKHLFFKAMKEDMRHKLWMAALSVLGNFLVLTVGWMIWRSNALRSWGGVQGLMQSGDARIIESFQEEAAGIFGAYLMIAGGIIAILTAIMTGLFSFRYLFHRNMVDTCHSLPVKRDTLYGIKYVNGILIWLVPFLVSLLLTFFMCCGLLRQVGGEARIPKIASDALCGIFILTVIYLLVYHVGLAAVMISGNVLNTLVSMMILGFGVMTSYGLIIGFFSVYMGTYYMPPVDLDTVVYGSPLISAPFFLFHWVDEADFWEIGRGLLLSAGMMAVLGAGAWLLYRNRASEAAEQGIWNKTTAFILRTVVGVAAGMCGWGFFMILVSDSRALGWGLFGAVLAGVCIFGVMDIIFQMDFKAFFSHKVQMAGTVAASLLICFTFYWDWFGYDTRLPEPEEIAEIAVFDMNLTNHYLFRMPDDARLENMHYQDSDTIYAFLERMVGHEREEGFLGETDRIGVKVTLNSGRSYYRNYWMRKEDKEVAWPILTSEEYLKNAYLIDDATLEGDSECRLIMGGEERYVGRILPQIRSAAEAYNREVLEAPDKALLRDGKLVAEVIFGGYYETADGGFRRREVIMEVYDYMVNTVAALQAAGFELPDAGELGIESFVLALECEEDATPEERIALAREQYGVSGPKEQAAPDSAQTAFGDVAVWNSHQVSIAEREEVEELFGLLSFEYAYYSNSVFGDDYVDVISFMKDGSIREWCLPKGALPEKYILRFGK